jgi:hypothetical protein
MRFLFPRGRALLTVGKMPKLSESDFAQDWLGQFDDDERPVAASLADSILLVGRDELYRGLRRLLDALLAERKDAERPLALYSERKVDAASAVDGAQASYTIEPFFPGTEIGRATGPGVAPVLAEEQEIGSEGAIANFITTYERQHRGAVLNHPGPDTLRDTHACEIVIVTDFIGSGKRVWEMIEAFWRVATIRSWKSYRLLRFAVVAYSGTDPGIAYVRSHRVRPDVRIVQGCPTGSSQQATPTNWPRARKHYSAFPRRVASSTTRTPAGGSRPCSSSHRSKVASARHRRSLPSSVCRSVRSRKSWGSLASRSGRAEAAR